MVVYLRSLAFLIGQAISVVAVALVGVLLFPLPFEIRYRFISRWALFNLWWLKVTCHLSFEVEGREHIPTKAAIVFCKHQSTWETLALQAILPPQIWLLKRELLWIPFFGWGLAMLEPIAIDRKAGREAIKQLINQGKKRLSDGRWVIIFPEGTRVPPGEHGEFKLGGAMLAERAQAPVLPIAHNAGYYWPKHSFLKYPGVIKVVIGPLISSEGVKATVINQRAEAWIRQKCEEITP